jgi:hypothetical protein
MMLRRIAPAVALAAVLALSGTAFASNNGGGPNKSSSSSISLALPIGPAATTGPNYGSSVTFVISTTETQSPYVNLRCYQNGALVAEGWAGYFDGALGSESFGLYSPQWTSGAADCTASLEMNSNGHWKELASTSFHVNA